MTNTTLLAGILIGTFVMAGLTLGNAEATVDMFMKIDDVPGESEKAGHPDEIDILSWGWAMSTDQTFSTGGGGGSDKVNVQDLSFSKEMGRASPSIMQFCCQGEHIPKITLTLCRTDDSTGFVEHCYLKITLSNSIIRSYNPSAQGGESVPVEKVTLNFENIKMDYTPQGDERPEFSGEKTFKPSYYLKGKKILEN